MLTVEILIAEGFERVDQIDTTVVWSNGKVIINEESGKLLIVIDVSKLEVFNPLVRVFNEH